MVSPRFTKLPTLIDDQRYDLLKEASHFVEATTERHCGQFEFASRSAKALAFLFQKSG